VWDLRTQKLSQRELDDRRLNAIERAHGHVVERQARPAQLIHGLVERVHVATSLEHGRAALEAARRGESVRLVDDHDIVRRTLAKAVEAGRVRGERRERRCRRAAHARLCAMAGSGSPMVCMSHVLRTFVGMNDCIGPPQIPNDSANQACGKRPPLVALRARSDAAVILSVIEGERL